MNTRRITSTPILVASRLAVAYCLTLLPAVVHAQAPVPPASISRSADGHVTVRAIHLDAPLNIDGNLSEAVYSQNQPVDGFIQTVPANGKPVSERTEAWVMFDDKFIYISAKLYDSAPPDKWIANELRRDTNQLRQNDLFGVLLDTFHDRRNGYNFYTNAIGGFTDQLVTDEGNPNGDWNPVWDVHAGRFDGGWTTEMAIPFKSLRYVPGKNQVWGIQMRRSIRRKNEWSHLTALPAANGGPNSVFRISQAATLVGLDLPDPSANIQIKPFVNVNNTSDLVRRPPVSNDLGFDYGGDLKYGITPNLTADVTVKTDFAQVEVDEQQLNLTRFSLQFPEKRDFFLEGRGTFDFGRSATSGGSGGIQLGFGSGGNSSPSVGAPTLFYSRRIGLDAGRVTPILVGGRLTGKVDRFSLGALNLETDEQTVGSLPKTNFTVLRLRRDILRRSVIGAMFTNRSNSTVVKGASNMAYGVDGTFSFGTDRQHQRLRGALRHRGPHDQQLQLHGAIRLLAGPVRLPRRLPDGGRELQPRDRLHQPQQLPTVVRVRAIQPAPQGQQARPQVHMGRHLRIPGDRQHRQPRDAQRRRTLPHGTADQRHDQPGGHRPLRVPGEAVHRGPRASPSSPAPTRIPM